MEIRSRFNNSLIFAADVPTMRECVEKAVRQKISLAGSGLSHENLAGGNFHDANFCSARLTGTNFAGANLDYAKFSNAGCSNVNFTGIRAAGTSFSFTDCRLSAFDNCDLSSTLFERTTLAGASFHNSRIRWSSHDLLAAILSESAQNNSSKRRTAGGILMSRDLCWGNFDRIAKPREKRWIAQILEPYARNDEGAPLILKQWIAEAGVATATQ